MTTKKTRTRTLTANNLPAGIPEEVATLFNRWDNYLYSTVDFNMADSPIHSYAHTERVLLHALSLGYDIFGNDDEALEILAHAALFHDTRRHDEYLDTGHGSRAAVHYAEFCQEHPQMTMHPESQYLMRYHDLDDNVGIKAIRKAFPESADRVLKLYEIFKDADALDRWRLGHLGLDPAYLRTRKAKESITFAKELVKQTMNADLLEEIDRMVCESLSRRMLLIVDPQIDFICGSLPVEGAEKAMNSLSEYIRQSDGDYTIKVVTADRHPWDHVSFADNGGQWPRHCVHDTTGAAIWPEIFNSLYTTEGRTYIFHKGENRMQEEYSIFANEAAARQIRKIVEENHIHRIDICGLAGDVCVLATLRDAINQMPDVEIDVLTDYSPSIDGGTALKEFIENR